MHISSLRVSNYKSLRGVSFHPPNLSVIVGANASGKSNFADAIDFVSEIYRHGLDVAVARKGGFENIAFRRMRRTKGAIEFEITIEVAANEFRALLRNARTPPLRYAHSFSLGALSSSIRSEYQVLSESLRIARLVDGEWRPAVSVSRSTDGTVKANEDDTQLALFEDDVQEAPRWTRFFGELKRLELRSRSLDPSELFLTSIARYALLLSPLISAVSGIRVFQISPTRSREFGVPIPRAELEATGANLPAVVDLLKRQKPVQWRRILDTMRTIIPRLTAINVDYTSSRTLGLYFAEDGVGRPWSVSEVSDGTIQTLALLVALHDERSSALVLEEPENSVHPWIIRRVLDAVRHAAVRKQVVITTHSPIVIGAVSPEQLFVMHREDGESHLVQATALDASFVEAWASGQVSTFDFLDSGAIREAIPPDPSRLEYDSDQQA